MKRLALSANGSKHAGKFFALVDDVDFEWCQHSAWSVMLNRNDLHYVFRKVGKKTVLLHREIYTAAFGLTDKDMIDHRNRNGLDCRRKNLRLAGRSSNAANSIAKQNNKSGIKGVYWHSEKHKWQSTITVKRRTQHLGYFSNKKMAAQAYADAAKRHYGEFARSGRQA